MSKREFLSRYNLIIKKLRRHPATFKEISEYLEIESEIQSYNFTVSKRTFLRDLEDIRFLYYIDITYDFSRKVYFIDDDNQSEANSRILEAFDTFNALNLSDRLSSHILFEKRRPAGTENLHGLLHTIQNQLLIKFSYQKFWEEEISKRSVEPYALKEFKHRWYVLARDQKDGQIKSFGLDRITNLEITNVHFKRDEKYKPQEAYKHCFGIISPTTEKPEEIILSFDPIQGKYIKSLPLHSSQKILIDNEKELQICLRLFITYDFVMELLSYGEYVKVLEPEELAKNIKLRHKLAVKNYN